MTLRLLAATLLAVAPAAHARNVVILDFAEDRKGALRAQIEDAVSEAGKVTVVPVSRFKDAAGRKRFKGAKVTSPEAVAAVARSLELSAAVTGIVGEKISVVILDPDGNELWSRELKHTRGLLSEDNARRLAAAIAAAAQSVAVAQADPEEAPEAPPERDGREADPPAERPGEDRPAREEELAGLDLSGETPDAPEPREGAARVPATDEPDEDPAPRPRRRERPAAPGAAPLVQLQLQGATTWRTYCARPGVASCADYDRTAATDPTAVPPGNPIDFTTQLPYLGFLLSAQLMPLAQLAGPLAGVGLVGSFGMGFSRTDIFNISGGTRVRVGTVISTERAFTAALAYRYRLPLGDLSGPPAFVGLRAGLHGTSFQVGSAASSPNIPNTNRLYPALTLEALFPLARYARLEGSGGVYLNTRVSPEDFRKFGAAASGFGWGAELGVSGDLFGPLGYHARVRLTQFHDRFQGAGSEWNTGGAATETFMALFWGASARF